MKRLIRTVNVIAMAVVAFACDNQDATKTAQPIDASPVFREFPYSGNARAESRSNYVPLYAEYLTTEESGQIGRTVYFTNVGNKQLSADFVPGTSLDGTDSVSYYIDEQRPSADLAVTASSAAISRAMNTWDDVKCSNLGLYRIPSDNSSTGLISELLGFGGSDEFRADVVHAGWLPAAFFDAIAPEGSTYILGVTFTIIYTDDDGTPTDIDNNGKADVAWREIYYNDAFTWRVGNHYDVETIALHEAGHALSQAHFGKAFADAGGGKLHFSPRAVMNAAYSGMQTSINATDNAGHCSNWASWNNK